MEIIKTIWEFMNGNISTFLFSVILLALISKYRIILSWFGIHRIAVNIKHFSLTFISDEENNDEVNGYYEYNENSGVANHTVIEIKAKKRNQVVINEIIVNYGKPNTYILKKPFIFPNMKGKYPYRLLPNNNVYIYIPYEYEEKTNLENIYIRYDDRLSYFLKF